MTQTRETQDGHDEDAHQPAVEGFGDATADDAFVEDDVADNTRGGGSGIYLTDLPDTLTSAGLTVEEFKGWKTRARGSGGLSGGPHAIIVHHTATGKHVDGLRDATMQAEEHKYSPISNLHLDRTGKWWVLAAGASNTNGKGNEKGPIPRDKANWYVIGIEAGNNGVGEPWPAVQLNSYVRGVAALADRYDLPTERVWGHAEWSREGKPDPAGPSPFGSINKHGTWDMDLFRKAVHEERKNSTSWSPAPSSKESRPDIDVHVIKENDTWWSIAKQNMGDPANTWKVLRDANGGADRVLTIGGIVRIPASFPGEATPGMKGSVVAAWQQALIAHGVIGDTPGNRDGEYGGGLERAVLALQQSWGWSKANGIADSDTWNRLQES